MSRRSQKASTRKFKNDRLLEEPSAPATIDLVEYLRRRRIHLGTFLIKENIKSYDDLIVFSEKRYLIPPSLYVFENILFNEESRLQALMQHSSTDAAADPFADPAATPGSRAHLSPKPDKIKNWLNRKTEENEKLTWSQWLESYDMSGIKEDIKEMHPNRDDVTVLIQGPLSNESLSCLNHYDKVGRVVISTWEGENISMINRLDPDGIVEKVVTGKIPDRSAIQSLNRNVKGSRVSLFKDTWLYALHGILNGLKEIDTKYTIRVRSDEYMSNLKPIVDMLLETKYKIITTNIFWRHDSRGISSIIPRKDEGWLHERAGARNIDYHVGDHCFIGETEILRKAYEGIIEGMMISNGGNEYWPACGSSVPEVQLGIAFTKAIFEIEYGMAEFAHDSFNEFISVIDINMLGKYSVRNNHQGTQWSNNYIHFTRLR
jgi:hypothetical protein